MVMRTSLASYEDFKNNIKAEFTKNKNNIGIIGETVVEVYDTDGTKIQESKAENTLKTKYLIEFFYSFYDYIIHTYHHNDVSTAYGNKNYPAPLTHIRLLNRTWAKKESEKHWHNTTVYEDELIGYATVQSPVTATDVLRGTINDSETNTDIVTLNGKRYQMLEIVLDFATNIANGTFNLIETRFHTAPLAWHNLGMSSSRLSVPFGVTHVEYIYSTVTLYGYESMVNGKATLVNDTLYYLNAHTTCSTESVYRTIQIIKSKLGSRDVEYIGGTYDASDTTTNKQYRIPGLPTAYDKAYGHFVKVSDDEQFMYVLVLRAGDFQCRLLKIEISTLTQIWAKVFTLDSRWYDNYRSSDNGAAFLFDEGTMCLKLLYNTEFDRLEYHEYIIGESQHNSQNVLVNVVAELGKKYVIGGRLSYLAEMHYYRGDKNRLIITRRSCTNDDYHTSVYILDINRTSDKLINVVGDHDTGQLYYDPINNNIVSKTSNYARIVPHNITSVVFSEDEILPITKTEVNTMKLKYRFYTPLPTVPDIDDMFEKVTMSTNGIESFSVYSGFISIDKFSIIPHSDGYMITFNPDIDERYQKYHGLQVKIVYSNDNFSTSKIEYMSLYGEDFLTDGYNRPRMFKKIITDANGVKFRFYMYNNFKNTTTSTYISNNISYSLDSKVYVGDVALRDDTTEYKEIFFYFNRFVFSDYMNGLVSVNINGTDLGLVSEYYFQPVVSNASVDSVNNLMDGENIITLTYADRNITYKFNKPAYNDMTLLDLSDYKSSNNPLVFSSVAETEDYKVTLCPLYHETYGAPYTIFGYRGTGIYDGRQFTKTNTRGFHCIGHNDALRETDEDYLKLWATYERRTGTISFNKVVVWLDMASPTRGPKDFMLEGSNDGGVTWMKVVNKYGINLTKSDKYFIEFKLPETVEYSMIRISSVSARIISTVNLFNITKGTMPDDIGIIPNYTNVCISEDDTNQICYRTDYYVSTVYMPSIAITCDSIRFFSVYVTHRNTTSNENQINISPGGPVNYTNRVGRRADFYSVLPEYLINKAYYTVNTLNHNYQIYYSDIIDIVREVVEL